MMRSSSASLSAFFPVGALTLLSLLALPDSRASQPLAAQTPPQDKFRQLEELLPTPNEQRTASGAPGPAYWQQRADYLIDVEIDEKSQTLTGRETVTYHNRSPHALTYLWLQLDQNYYAADADSRLIAPAPDFSNFTYAQLEALLEAEEFRGEVQVTAVTDGTGAPLPHAIIKTMMRVDLSKPLLSGEETRFSVAWHYRLNSWKGKGGRTGYEIFPSDGNALYTVGHWYPRLAAYTDATGWQVKQYLESREFALEFGNFRVSITVPSDHVVAATGVLANAKDVLSSRQRERLERAQTAARPVFIVTPDEARKAERSRSTERKTWIYVAENVRDFAFASSRKFIWDAMGVANQTAAASDVAAPESAPAPAPVLAMSFYPNEAGPLWIQYSTRAIAHALDRYSHFTFPYPYPVAISVNSPMSDMEYPMIGFVMPRTEGRSYSRTEKYTLISMILHEVGHNYFPMVVNTDERQWAWMDEGLNSFLQELAEREWERGYPERPSWVTEPVTTSMTRADRAPIMTAADSLPASQAGFLGYTKPAAALKVLRETILGRENFDRAFRAYARRWMFKRPYPADFFRSMEDASGVDLDWFWRGWFYGSDSVDLAIGTVQLYRLDTRDPEIEKRAHRPADAHGEAAGNLVDRHPELRDFYNEFDETTILPSERKAFEKLIQELREAHIDPQLLRTARYFYAVELKNVGGLPMPVILQIGYADDTSEELRIPAEIWQRGDAQVRKLLMTKKKIKRLDIDPGQETVDADMSNNSWQGTVVDERVQLKKPDGRTNPMQEVLRN